MVGCIRARLSFISLTFKVNGSHGMHSLCEFIRFSVDVPPLQDDIETVEVPDLLARLRTVEVPDLLARLRTMDVPDLLARLRTMEVLDLQGSALPPLVHAIR
ncbi:hypothetical protein J6590_024573 [Homalodisca vitripennis]|nr:hypothetical protein J6590_024573 [Homalodisca vitripennis]